MNLMDCRGLSESVNFAHASAFYEASPGAGAEHKHTERDELKTAFKKNFTYLCIKWLE